MNQLCSSPFVTVDDIHRLLAGHPAGSRLRLTIVRNGERRELTAVAGEA